MEQKKKLTNAQLQRRIAKAVIMLDRTKDTREVYFSDKGLRLTVDATEGYALIATGYHTHFFRSFTASGVSRPFLYTQRIIDIANENLDAIKTENGYSFVKLLEVLKAKEDQAEYNIAVYYEWWCQTCFSPLYNIAEDEISSWLVYFKYLNTIAINSILLDEHKEDVTNKQFVERFLALIKEFTDNVDERVLFHALSDEERMKQEMEAIAANEVEQTMEAQTDGNK